MSVHASRTRRLTLALAAVVLSLAAAACAAATPPSVASPTPPATAVPPRASLEGRFTYAEMPAFFDAVLPMVRAFFDEEFPRLARPGRVLLVPRGQSGYSGCYGGDGRPAVYDSASYEYCPNGAAIYIGQDMMWSFYRLGDAAPVIGLAHEWGHHLQAMRRLPPPRTPAQSVAYENQADCIAGAWARFADAKGWLEAEDDLADVGSLLRAIGTREGPGRDHGTAAERLRAFEAGFGRGLTACNDYVPSSPLV